MANGKRLQKSSILEANSSFARYRRPQYLAIRPTRARGGPHGRRGLDRPHDRAVACGGCQSPTDIFDETLIAEAELRLGRRARHAERARAAAATAATMGEMAAAGWANLLLAEALGALGQGDDPEARSALSRALELAGQHGLVPLAERAGTLHNLRKQAEQ